MKKRYEALIWIGILMIAIGAAYAYGSSPLPTLDDHWKCGYVNTTAMNLSEVRDCYRD